MILAKTIHSLADLLWRPRCAACDAFVPDRDDEPFESVFCETCLVSLVPVSAPRCPRCGIPFDSAGADHLCGQCLAHPPQFVEAHIPYQYGGALRDAVTRFKYLPAPWLHRPLATLMYEAIAEATGFTAIVPVPLHRKRLSRRGFNQSALLAGVISHRLEVPLVTGRLRRVRDTPPQARHGRQERMDALTNAFEVKRPGPLQGASILLVDDVVTTTATVRAASAALKAAGAARVEIAAIARAV